MAQEDSSIDQPCVGRRRVLQGSALTVTAGALASTAGAVPPQDRNRDTIFEDQGDDPDDLEVSDDLDDLKRYQPAYLLSPDAERQMIGVYGWIAEHPNYDTRAYYYWTRYSHQDSIWDLVGLPGSAAHELDGHLWDHEPSIVYVNKQTGDVEDIVYTGYHHYAAIGTAENTRIVELEADDSDSQHAALEVIDPWHHYRRVLPENNEFLSLAEEVVEVQSFLRAREEWYEAGIFNSTSPVAIEHPWEMRNRASWWQDGTLDARMALVWRLAGLRGADQRDDLRVDD